MQIVIAVLLAAAPLAGEKIQREAEDRARAEVADLLRTLCPEQCVLLSVRARMDEEQAGGDPSPGFDAPGARTVPVVRSLSASIVVDQRLPMQFRTRLKTLIANRIKSAGAPVDIALEQVAFPVKNPPYLEAREPPPQPATPPQQPPQPEQQPKIAAATPVPRLQDKLIEQAPLLAVIVLLGAVVLTLGVLVYLAARRQQQEPLYEALPGDDAQQQAAARPEPASEAFPAVRLRKLEKQLADDRVLRNAVVREALGRGEHALVARWTRELGDFLLDDLRGDGTLSPALAAVAVEVARPPDAATRAAALQELEGRALAARLSRAGDATAFAFLEGVREEAFIAALKGISTGAQEVVLRLAPAGLRAAALREMPAAQRQQIALAWVRKPEVSAQYALAAADELRARLADLHSGPADLDRALSDLLDSLPRAEQDALVEQLRREGDPRAFSGLITESALAHAPRDLLGAAVLAVAPERLVGYLAGADEGIRADLLSACPARLRGEVEEELALRPRVSQEEFVAARRELLAHVREESVKRGLKPADVRAWRPRVVQTP